MRSCFLCYLNHSERQVCLRVHQNLIITSGAVVMSLLLQGGTFEQVARVVSIDPVSEQSVLIEEQYIYGLALCLFRKYKTAAV